MIGHPLYPFLPWDTFMGTFKVVMFILLMSYAAYMALCLIDEALKPTLTKKRDAMSAAQSAI